MFLYHYWESDIDYSLIYNMMPTYCFFLLPQTILNDYEIIQNITAFQIWFSPKTLQ